MKHALSSKILLGFERISEAIKSLLWEKAKAHGISPIQIQLMLFIDEHNQSLSNVSHLAKEFNVTKPTVSDAIRVLIKKDYLEKDFSSTDSRSYTLFLTAKGKSLTKELDNVLTSLEETIDNLDSQNSIYHALTQIITSLHKNGILTIQRNCQSCQYHSVNDQGHHCAFLQRNIATQEIQIDCPDHLTVTV
ncbi:MAG: MarR family winged helix-turn-helix transcriptional regulator [Reichenbachiella sp.]